MIPDDVREPRRGRGPWQPTPNVAAALAVVATLLALGPGVQVAWSPAPDAPAGPTPGPQLPAVWVGPPRVASCVNGGNGAYTYTLEADYSNPGPGAAPNATAVWTLDAQRPGGTVVGRTPAGQLPEGPGTLRGDVRVAARAHNGPCEGGYAQPTAVALEAAA